MKYLLDISFFICWMGGFLILAGYMGSKNVQTEEGELVFVLTPVVVLGAIYYWQAGKRIRKEKGLK